LVLLARNSLRRVRERMDDSHYGGAVLLGLSGLVVVAHGRSNPTAIRHAIRVAKQAIEQDIITQIQRVNDLAQDAEPVAAAEAATL
jgi:glycerol-3-phosphate acyltransferase PlsX